MSHPTRLRLECLIVDKNWPAAEAAKMFMVSERTARKWADRYRFEGGAGMADRSSRPHHSPPHTRAGGPRDRRAAPAAPAGTTRLTNLPGHQT